MLLWENNHDATLGKLGNLALPPKRGKFRGAQGCPGGGAGAEPPPPGWVGWGGGLGRAVRMGWLLGIMGWIGDG